jgi:hypothetical protein
MSWQARFDLGRCERVGNLPLFRALKEIAKYETSAAGDVAKSLESALAFHHAAAMVCCCSFRLSRGDLKVSGLRVTVSHVVYQSVCVIV